MKDTPDEIYKIQYEIFMKKSPEERFLLNLDLTEFIREMAKRRILSQNPEISQNELKVKMFEEFYSDVFNEKEIKNITDKLYHFNNINL